MEREESEPMLEKHGIYSDDRIPTRELIKENQDESSSPARQALRGHVGTNSKRSENKITLGSPTKYQTWKGILDRVLALLVLIVTSPILLSIFVLIKLDSPGSPILRQERVGRDGRRFTLYKFRSMYIDHDDTKYREFLQDYIQRNISGKLCRNGEDPYELIKDPRVTRFGAILRKTNLDELPQFFNILKGEMSLIGPRPDIPFAVSMYQEHHLKRLDVTPGITGLWQVSGRKRMSFDDMIRLDIEYIKRQSLLLDLKIIFLTVCTILKGDGS